MFGSRRHRPPVPPLTAATADPNAATAAAAVFKRHESNAASSLSAAAAAAALRARPTTPTRVADVQTKRTLRRSASVASSRTASEPTRDEAPTLTRRGSSGSMTERTFRSPSPHRPASSGSLQSRSRSFNDKDMPPVPALPKDMGVASSSVRSASGSAPQRASQQQQRRVTSLTVGTAPMRLASQKLASGDGPAWFGAAKIGDLGSVRRTDPAMASPPSSPLQLLAREEDSFDGARPSSQASSINFSYPTRTRRGSTQTPDLYATPEAPSHIYQPQNAVEDAPEAHQPRARQQPRAQTAVTPARTQSTSSAANRALVYDPNSRRMVRQADLLAVEQKVINASLQPTGSKRKKKPPQRAGSHLAAGTMGRTKIDISHTSPAKTQPSHAVRQAQAPLQSKDELEPAAAAALTTPVQEETRADAEEPAVKAIISSPRIEAKRLEQQRVHSAIDLPQIGAPAVPTTAPTAPAAAKFAIRKQPSIVQEEPEPEQAENEVLTERHVSDTLDAVPGRQRVHPEESPEEHHQPALPPQGTISLPTNSSESRATASADQQQLQPGSASVSEDGRSSSSSSPGAAAAVGRGVMVAVSRGSERTHSSSPARQAHFGPVQQNLTVKHSPPPRSVSPRKSAMKHTSPTRNRDASPSGTGGGGGDNASEASAGSVSQQEAVGPSVAARKKSVRVSFDESSTGVVGEAAPVVEAGRDSPLMTTNPSETRRHSWLPSFGRSHKDVPLLDDDEVMTPRPALPSFGSVRNRKPRDTSPDRSERPLVRPKTETRYSPPLLPSPPLGASNDHAIGAVLSNRHGIPSGERGERAAGAGHGEPLPPVVTSVEGNGYFSDSSDDASSFLSSEFDRPPVTLPPVAPERQPGTEVQKEPAPPVNGSAEYTIREVPTLQNVKEQEAPPAPPIPAISVSRPTPLATEDRSPRQYFVDVPGGFPESESDLSTASVAQRPVQIPATVESAGVAAAENRPAEATLQAVQPTPAEDSSDSESSIYSDAYEDLSDVSGDGFQSLDAVIESPIQQSPLPESAHATARPEPASFETISLKPPEEAPQLQTELSSATTAVESPPTETPQDEWEKAKAYWRSLTAEKRAQLEKETKEEAGTEADMDDEVKTEPKPTKKKSVERRNSERKALAVHMAQQMMAHQQQQQRQEIRDPERTYMVKPGSRWTGADSDTAPMRKTLRQEQERQAPVTATHGPTLRKSMRTSGPVAGRHDPRTAESHATTQRPMSSPAAAMAPPKTGAHRRSATQVELTAGTFQPPTITRRGSTGSESSFKRARSARAAQGSGGGFGFRHSMRPTSPPSSSHGGDARSSNKRFSLRALSPAGSVTANTSTSQMRTTLRGAVPAARQKSPTGGLRMPSFGLSYGGGKKSGSGGKGAGGGRGKGFASRLADSSDEEDRAARSAGFRSRFDESSDDEPVMPMPASLRPLPASTSATMAHTLRKESSAASTALPEEEEEESGDEFHQQQPTTAQPPLAAPTVYNAPASQQQQQQQQQSLRRTRSGRGTLLPQTTTNTDLTNPPQDGKPGDSPRQQRRTSGGILSVLRRRGTKDKDNRVGRAGVSESAARRDTRLERSVGQLERIRSRDELEFVEEGEDGEGVREGGVAPVSPASPTKSPRLQKRASGSGGGGGFGKRKGAALARALPDVVAGPQEQAAAAAAAGADEDGDVFRDDAHTPLPPAHFRRASTSGNLGTRTLSSGGGGGGGGGFLHLHLPHRRVSSMGVEQVTAGSPGVGMDGGSVAGSVAGGSMAGSMAGPSSTRKKRFGALRRMFGLDE